jgi:hypothetical protein
VQRFVTAFSVFPRATRGMCDAQFSLFLFSREALRLFSFGRMQRGVRRFLLFSRETRVRAARSYCFFLGFFSACGG